MHGHGKCALKSTVTVLNDCLTFTTDIMPESFLWMIQLLQKLQTIPSGYRPQGPTFVTTQLNCLWLLFYLLSTDIALKMCLNLAKIKQCFSNITTSFQGADVKQIET